MIKKSLRYVFDRAGYEIRRKGVPFSNNFRKGGAECDRMINMICNNTMVAREGLVELYYQALFCERRNIPGDFIECGVWKGGAVGLMALVNLCSSSYRRHIHLFDSFQEICEPDESVDGKRALWQVRQRKENAGTKGRLAPLKGIYDHRGGPGTIQENRELLENKIGYDPKYLHYHQGWFQDVLPEVYHDIEQIAILRIDADWYASTKICLQYLFDKVVSGGFVIVDDYGAYDGCRQAVDEFVDGYGRPLYLNQVNQDIRYIIVP